ncbi:MAG TPA: c-type cytochrome domain-containing protein [Pirellulaceae bacterium]|nr:c-type cytochrome domain-containing protein [Pirellulaceae bacterium]
MRLVLLVLAATWLIRIPLAAAATPEQRAEMAAVGTLLTKAGNLYKNSKFKEAGEAVKEVQSRLEKLAEGADPQMGQQLEAMHKRLINAHALLELEGISLAALKPLTPPKAAGKPGDPPAVGTVSFVKQVAPILNARCGGCHVRNARGMFSMATYESLMKGPPPGKVVFPGNVAGSDLIVKVQDKEMPPNGAGIPDPELAMLKKWVEEGAKFDGPDPMAMLTSLVAGAPAPAPAPMITVQQATGNETVSFSQDIAPVLVANCINCHGADRPRNNFSLNTPETLLRGGDRGEPVLPGRAADSLLVKKLKGTADGARMPMGGSPLDDTVMAKIEKWIAEGAKFDSSNPKQPIEEIAAIARAKKATHAELSADRAKLADENWQLGMPGMAPFRTESENFLLLGSVNEETLGEIAKQAEALAPKIMDIFKGPAGQPLVKGKLTLFVFAEKYDYGEFGKMVEKRPLPPAWRGHSRYTVVDAYGAVLNPRSSDYSLDALLAQQIAALYIAAQGQGVPHWFAEGCGRVVASRLAPASDKRVAQWNDELPGVMGMMTAPDDFLTGKLPPEEADICSYNFAKFLMSDGRRFRILMDGLKKGGDFAKTFEGAYGPPAQVAAAWARNPPKGR